MSSSTSKLWRSLETWSSLVFLVAGGLMLVATVAIALQLFTAMDGLTNGPAGLAGFIGIAISYVGLLGLYPRLVDRAPRLARASVALLLIPVVLIVVDVTALIVDATPPLGQFGPSAFMAVLALFAVGAALAAVASLRTRVPSRAIGGALLVFAVAWFGLLGSAQVYGFPIPDAPNLVVTGLMALSLLFIGYTLWTDSDSTDQTEPVAETA